jgi:hypothetical protein
MGRLISRLKALANIFGTSGASWGEWGSPFGQSVELEVMPSRQSAKNLSSDSSTIDSWRSAMALGDPPSKWDLSGFKMFDDSILGIDNVHRSAIEQQLIAAQANQMLAAQAQQMQPFLNQATAQAVQQPPDPRGKANEKALHLLMMRMQGVRNTLRLGADDFMCCHVREDTVHVFFVLKGNSGNTSEQVDIFPSDKLITQLRLIMS